jgi:hypothetical protein
MAASSINVKNGIITRKYEKYSKVNTLLKTMKGAAAGFDPKNIRVKKIPTKNQKKILCNGANETEIILFFETTF